MARGNDSESARRDLDRQYGEHDSAEGLIRAHEDSWDQEHSAALNKPVDIEATAALDFDAIDPKYKGGIVRTAAVRGGRLFVIEEAHGTLNKWSEPYKPSAAEKKKAATAPPVVVPSAPPPPAATADHGGGGQTGGSEGSTEVDLSEAPAGVRSQAIQDKLDALKIDRTGQTNKAGYWSLLPEDARKELAEAAAAA